PGRARHPRCVHFIRTEKRNLCRTDASNRRQKIDAGRDAGVSALGSGQSARPDRHAPYSRQSRPACGAGSKILMIKATLIVLLFLPAWILSREPQSSPPAKSAIRARALGIPFDGLPGKLNAITDVAGVEVGFTTLISGEGKLEVGKGPVRTGVTAVVPRGHDSLNDPVYAGTFSLNGNGEMTGTAWVEE